MIRFACPTCNGIITTSSKKAGSVKACPGCGQMVQVPDEVAIEEKPGRTSGEKPALGSRRGNGLKVFWALVRISLWGVCFGAIVLGFVNFFVESPKGRDDQQKIEIAARALVWLVGPFYLARTFESSTKSFEELVQRIRGR
jgi:hypothetical protein